MHLRRAWIHVVMRPVYTTLAKDIDIVGNASANTTILSIPELLSVSNEMNPQTSLQNKGSSWGKDRISYETGNNFLNNFWKIMGPSERISCFTGTKHRVQLLARKFRDSILPTFASYFFVFSTKRKRDGTRGSKSSKLRGYIYICRHLSPSRAPMLCKS